MITPVIPLLAGLVCLAIAPRFVRQDPRGAVFIALIGVHLLLDAIAGPEVASDADTDVDVERDSG